jgi:hypothetical protein
VNLIKIDIIGLQATWAGLNGVEVIFRERPPSFGPAPIGAQHLVARTILWRRPFSHSPTIVSLAPVTALAPFWS